jgi:hypothetical protein
VMLLAWKVCVPSYSNVTTTLEPVQESSSDGILILALSELGKERCSLKSLEQYSKPEKAGPFVTIFII